MIRVYALCTGAIEIDRASMVSDLAPGQPWTVPVSHLHFDHCGGNEFFQRATFLVQRPELEAARRPGFVPSYSPSPIDFDHALDYRTIDGEHDVFGDGAVILIPTYGYDPAQWAATPRAPAPLI